MNDIPVKIRLKCEKSCLARTNGERTGCPDVECLGCSWQKVPTLQEIEAFTRVFNQPRVRSWSCKQQEAPREGRRIHDLQLLFPFQTHPANVTLRTLADRGQRCNADEGTLAKSSWDQLWMDENLRGQGVIKMPSDGGEGSRGFVPKSHNEVFTLSVKSSESGRWNYQHSSIWKAQRFYLSWPKYQTLMSLYEKISPASPVDPTFHNFIIYL